MYQLKRFLFLGGILGLLATNTLVAAEQKAVIKVYGMFCQACANGVAGSLKSLDGVKSAEVNAETGQATVIYEDSQTTVAKVKKQIELNGFSTTPPKKAQKG